MKRGRHVGKGAFSLIEVLVVTGVLGAVGLVIGSALAAGIRVWERAKVVNGPREEADLVVTRFARELMNACPFYALEFEGAPERVAFPAILARQDEEGAERETFGEVVYSYNRAKKALIRTVAAYPREPGAKQASETVLADVVALQLRYLKRARTAGEKWEWLDSWSEQSRFPHGVRLALTIADGTGTTRLLRTIRFRAEF